MKRTGYSPAAAVMGVILSPIADNELIRMFQLYGERLVSGLRHAADRGLHPGAACGDARLERLQPLLGTQATTARRAGWRGTMKIYASRGTTHEPPTAKTFGSAR